MIKYIVLAICLLSPLGGARAADLTDVVSGTYEHRNAPSELPRGSWRHSNRGGRVHTVLQTPNSYRDGRPRAWCGWYMRQIKGGSADLNVARNWANWGSPASPGVGTVVVWPHHVGFIVGNDSRGWIVRSGNYGGRVADVPLSRFARPIAFRG